MILVNAVICRLQFIENTERGVCPLLKRKKQLGVKGAVTL